MAKPKSIDWSPANWPYLFYRFFSSYGLAAIVLIFMTLITLFGTYYQVDHGLVAAKKKYFHSWFVNHSLFGRFPLPLPGGLLLMSLLFVNMAIGAIIKVKKRWRGAGLLISHCGMLLLLAGGFVTWAYASDGYMALYPGMKSTRVNSYRDWQIEIMPLIEDSNTAEKAWVIPHRKLGKIGPEESETFSLPDLPFDVVVNGFYRNASPIPVSAPMSAQAKGPEIDGFKLMNQDLAKSAEQNLPGCYVEFKAKEGEEIVAAILSSHSARFDAREKPMPFSFDMGGKKYAALLTKKTWGVPFEVRLDEFIFEKHPGTTMARNYESRVTRLEKDQPDKAVEIKMNEPMRYAGFTFFQESYGPPNGKPGEMFSQFAVANNPADKWPEIACWITGIGLAIHFLIKLFEFINRSRRKRAQA